MDANLSLILFLGLILVLSGIMFQSKNKIDREIDGYRWHTLEELEDLVRQEQETSAAPESTQAATTQAATTQAATTQAATTQAATTQAATTQAATTQAATTQAATTQAAKESSKKTKETKKVVEKPVVTKAAIKKMKEEDKKFEKELDRNLEIMNTDQILDVILHSSLEKGNEEVDKQYGSAREELYKNLIYSAAGDENEEPSMRKHNEKRQAFAEILLFDLVRKQKKIIKLLKNSFKREKIVTDKLNKALTLNSLLQDKINEIKKKQDDLKVQRENLENLSSRYHVIRLGDDALKSLKDMGLFENIPEELREQINPNKVNIIKV